MKPKKIIGRHLLIVALFTILFGHTGYAVEITLRYAELNPPAHPMTRGAYEYARLMKEGTGGRVDIQIYDSGQLGDEKSMLQALQFGAVDFFRTTVMNMEDFGVDSFSVFGLPYIFRDLGHLGQVLRSDIGQKFLDDIESAGIGMIGLGYMEEGPRNMFFATKEVRKLSDVKGLKIRVPETQLMMDTMSALGANPTPLAYSELYTSIQTGVVDGAENGITGYVTNSFFEVAPIYVRDAHTFGAGLLLISETSWNRLGGADRKILKDCAAEAMDFVLEITKKIESEYYAQMAEKGIRIVEVEDPENWRAAVENLHRRYGAAYADVISRIKAM
ncbi:MAG: TRAP transporter substrate-binding protein [Planctomycetota bacterium]|jgi:tripartite ATP-independent transporter DctP family solute receptor|nr:TRAP transporter substrate-binding protein [Planctomycetota bacterium]